MFRGDRLNPLTPGNTGYMLWMLMGFTVVLAVLVVTLGRVGKFGRVKTSTSASWSSPLSPSYWP